MEYIFIKKYFLQPILVEQGYNYINTITYALIALGLLYLIYLVLQKAKINIDLKFFISITPFILFGSSIRAFVDNNYLTRNFWIISPGIYLLTATLFLASLLIGWITSQKIKIEYWKLIFSIGLIISTIAYFYVATQLAFTNIMLALVIVIISALAILFSYFILSKLKLKWAVFNLSFLAISAQLFDSINTSMILGFIGGFEKHPLPRFVIEATNNSFSFIPLKLAFIIPAVYAVTKWSDDPQLRNLLLISIATLGLSQGLRNLISLVLT